MVYKDNFVVVVKCDGKILREKDGAVILPFGSHYSLQLKNLEPRKANIKVSVDGQDVLGSSSFIIQPNSDFELQGFLEGMTVRNKFKFIQKTKEIQEHRGDRIDDGIIRVEFAFEKQVIRRSIIHDHHHHDVYHHRDVYHHYPPYRPYFPYWPCEPHFTSGSFTCNDDVSKGFTNDDGSRGIIGEEVSCYNSNVESVSSPVDKLSKPMEDEGITVKGEETRQDFIYGSIGELEPSKVITILLRGTKSNSTIVSEPVTVKTKLTCPTCGKRSVSSSKFCSGCGTFLE